MRFASFDPDFFQLRSAEEDHRQHPDTFHIPDPAARSSLRRGQAAKLIFEIEGEGEDGEIEILGERMWVIVSEAFGGHYIGILDNDPMVEPADDVYLCRGAEIPFGPEHVIAIGDPPSDYYETRLSAPPTRVWPRD